MIVCIAPAVNRGLIMRGSSLHTYIYLEPINNWVPTLCIFSMILKSKCLYIALIVTHNIA